MEQYYILKYGNRQWLANKGANLKIDFINPTTNTIEVDCIYDSEVGICNKKVICTVKKAEFKEKKIMIVKHIRRHNSRKHMGFRAKSTLVVVGVS